MPGGVTVPETIEEALAAARSYVERRFSNFVRHPDEGVIRVDDERFVLVRCESLYLGLFDGLARRMGDDAAFEFIYTMAHSIGSSDCEELTARRGAQSELERIACGPPFFAFNGWAAVEFFPDTEITSDDDCVLHYRHPNTFESEVLARRADIEVKAPACLFSAGYSAGWVSYALRKPMHARELQCVACGAESCEFVMAPEAQLDRQVKRFSPV
jgi:hypothetical protein